MMELIVSDVHSASAPTTSRIMGCIPIGGGIATSGMACGGGD
jgi:hypothetical protein